MGSKICGVLVAGVMGIAFSYRATAEVSDEEFKALKDAVQQLGDKVQKLEQTHEADQKTHEADQLKIRQLQQQVGETQKAATEAQQQVGSATQMKRRINHLEEQMNKTREAATEAQGKATAPGQLQPIAPVPAGVLATHNFTLAGDAEVQFGRVAGQHSALRLPILRRFSYSGRATACCLKAAWTLSLARLSSQMTCREPRV